jgi:maleylpyruvate isomerase
MNARDWMDVGTGLFLSALDRLADDELSAPTGLEGWSRAHVVAHVHYNAEALRRLLSWAATGVESRMYASVRQREEEIEAGSALQPQKLRALVGESAAALSSDIASMPAGAWDSVVVTARGRSVPASEIPWMRTREVAVHAIDLDAGVSFHDLPEELNAALVADAAAGRTAELAAWLTGRAAAAPVLDKWL